MPISFLRATPATAIALLSLAACSAAPPGNDVSGAPAPVPQTLVAPVGPSAPAPAVIVQ